jgi:hypothetical protein
VRKPKEQTEEKPAVVDDESISTRMRRRREEVSRKSFEDMTIAEKLTIRAMEQSITVPFVSNAGNIPVEIRLPTLAEYDLLSTFQRRWEAAVVKGDLERANALANDIFSVMADLCVDDSLNETFFKEGIISASDFHQIVKEALLEYNRRIKSARSFRDEEPGSAAIMRLSGKIPT